MNRYKFKKTKMCGFATRLMWGEDPDVPNPVSGLTMRDVYHIQKVWTTVYNNSDSNGMELLMRLFTKNPEIRGFFKQIKDLNDEEARTSVQFKAHVQNFVGSLNTAIANLHEPEVVKALFQRVGDSHKPRRIEKKHFLELKEVTVELISNDYKISEPACNSWSKFMDFINKVIYEG